MHNEPRVSIGLPVYNGEKYLREALNSILAQSYIDFELIISDNASTDQTQSICLEYAAKDQRVRYHRNDENIGAAPNHNLVFNLARGEYFRWAGYDDRISQDFLLKCVEVLDTNPDAVLCMPRTKVIDENGKDQEDFEYDVDASSPELYKRFRSFVITNHTGSYSYGLMRTDVVAKTSLEGSYPSSDLVLFAELALYGQFHFMPDRLFYRRFHSDKSTRGNLKDERNRILWNDTSLQDKLVLIKWLYLDGLLKAIRNAPLSIVERIQCYLIVFRWAFFTRAVKGLIKDVLLAAQHIILHPYSKFKSKILSLIASN